MDIERINEKVKSRNTKAGEMKLVYPGRGFARFTLSRNPWSRSRASNYFRPRGRGGWSMARDRPWFLLTFSNFHFLRSRAAFLRTRAAPLTTRRRLITPCLAAPIVPPPILPLLCNRVYFAKLPRVVAGILFLFVTECKLPRARVQRREYTLSEACLRASVEFQNARKGRQKYFSRVSREQNDLPFLRIVENPNASTISTF